LLSNGREKKYGNQRNRLQISPNFANVVNLWWFDTQMGIFDLTTSLWLLFRGLRVPRAADN
jgi:hypothetical protein